MPKKDNSRTKVGVLFLGRKRPGFDMSWGSEMESRVRVCFDRSGFSIFEPSQKAVDEPSFRKAVGECKDASVDVLVLLQTTMSDGRLAPTLAQLWPAPPILWATPEKADGDMISSCSLVGAHAWGSTLSQMGHSYEVVYGDPTAPEIEIELESTIRLLASIRKLRDLRIGIVGGQAPGYFAMSADPFAIHRGIGAQLQTFSLLEFKATLEGLDSDLVAQDVADTKKLKLGHKDTSDEDLPMASSLYLAMRHYLEQESLDALSVRCWPEMPNIFGQWPYLGIARLVEQGWAVACEGDADGAVSAWLGESLGMGRCYLSDWLEHDGETITLWHGGAAPMSLSPPPGEPGGPQIARHFNIKKPAVVEATLRADMPATLMRLWRLNGRYHLTACEAVTIKPRRHLMGTNGVVRLLNKNPKEWFMELCHQGMPHHVAVFPGHHQSLLRRFARLMNIVMV